MKALIFTGALERREDSISERLSNYVSEELKAKGVETTIFKIADSGVPLFDITLKNLPAAVEMMSIQFLEADVHIWLTPLYHGSMTGVMKNCLDWLECTATYPKPYLTGKKVGLVCWADGVQAMQGINAMDAVAKSLRAWTVPYSVPIQRFDLFDKNGVISDNYRGRLEILMQLLIQDCKG